MPRPCPLLDEGARARNEQACEAVQLRLAETRAALKRERERVRRQEHKARAAWQLSRFVANVALILFALSQCSCDCPVAFLAQHGAKQGWPVKSDEDLASLVHDLFLAMEVSAYIELTDASNSSEPSAMKVAVRFRACYAAYAWVKGLNKGKGVAPPSSLVGAKIEEMQSMYPSPFAYANLTLPWRSNYRVVVHRWRRSFNSRYGSIRRRDVLSEEEMQTKALALLSLHRLVLY